MPAANSSIEFRDPLIIVESEDNNEQGQQNVEDDDDLDFAN